MLEFVDEKGEGSMELKQKETMIAYRCPVCGYTEKSLVGAFSLSGRMYKLKSECGQSEMTVELVDNDMIQVKVPCVICPNPHVYTVSSKIFFSDTGFIFQCPYTGIDIGYVAGKKYISKMIRDSDKRLNDMITQSQLGEISAINGKKKEKDDFSMIVDTVRYVVSELEEEGKIICDCKDDSVMEDGSSRFYTDVNDDSIFVICKKCGAHRKIEASSTMDAEAFLGADFLHLGFDD